MITAGDNTENFHQHKLHKAQMHHKFDIKLTARQGYTCIMFSKNISAVYVECSFTFFLKQPIHLFFINA